MYLFRFLTTKEYKGEPRDFQCILKKQKCQLCKKQVSIGLPFCSIHLQSALWLKSKKSTIPNAGNGIFAWNPDMGKRDEPLFNKGDHVWDYEGEIVSRKEEYERYGANTAPYSVDLGYGSSIDGSCYRGLINLINHDRNRKNVEMNLYDGGVEVRATKKIYHGDELFVDYGKAYRFTDKTQHSTKSIDKKRATRLIKTKQAYNGNKILSFKRQYEKWSKKKTSERKIAKAKAQARMKKLTKKSSSSTRVTRSSKKS